MARVKLIIINDYNDKREVIVETETLPSESQMKKNAQLEYCNMYINRDYEKDKRHKPIVHYSLKDAKDEAHLKIKAEIL